MVNSRARGMTLMENYKSPSTAATKTFTFPAIDWDKTAYLLLEIEISVTLALILEMTYNSITTAYFDDGTETAAGSVTVIDNGTADTNEILTATILSGVNKVASGSIKIKQTSPPANLHAISDFYGGIPIHSHIGHTQQSDFVLTSITIATSTSTWLAGTRMTLYKVQR